MDTNKQRIVAAAREKASAPPHRHDNCGVARVPDNCVWPTSD